jgi:hypothetical protein
LGDRVVQSLVPLALCSFPTILLSIVLVELPNKGHDLAHSGGNQGNLRRVASSLQEFEQGDDVGIGVGDRPIVLPGEVGRVQRMGVRLDIEPLAQDDALLEPVAEQPLGLAVHAAISGIEEVQRNLGRPDRRIPHEEAVGRDEVRPAGDRTRVGLLHVI